MTIHLMIIFSIGIFVGVSVVSHADDMNFQIRESQKKNSKIFNELHQNFEENSQKMNSQFELYKKYIYNGSEVQCRELSNYVIDNNINGELKIIFNESFHKAPKIFLTINGFLYKPHLGLNEKVTQSLEFEIIQTTDRYFKLYIKTDSNIKGFFDVVDFDRIDLCYFAFV